MRRRIRGTPRLPNGTMRIPTAVHPSLILLLLVAAQAALGQGIDLRLRTSGNAVSADLVFQWEKWEGREELLENVRGGLGSRVEFLFRVLEKRPSFLSFLREVQVSETSLSRSASFDIFSNEYSVTSDGAEEAFFSTPEDFLRRFFAVEDHTVLSARRPGTNYAVAVQVRLTPIRLVPPLNIIALFGGISSFTSPWVRREVAP